VVKLGTAFIPNSFSFRVTISYFDKNEWVYLGRMRFLVTGASGTIGKVLVEMLKARGDEVFAWDRQQVPINDYYKMENFVKLIRPNALIHLAYTQEPDQSWFVNYEWASELAWITRLLRIRFVFISTNLVFSHRQQGPFTIQSVPDATEGYGFEKRKSEARVMQQNPESIIARLGWQISLTGGNSMIEYFRKKFKEEALIKASLHWIPACSFVDHTAQKLIELSENYLPGICMIDSNTGRNVFEIACALNHQYNFNWSIQPSEDYGWDSRMLDERMQMPSLESRLKF
jgi:dTDP-4-dehydrorhamnose reductase